MRVEKPLIDGGYYYLFRGDVRLPIGVFAVSPLVRRLLWQGLTLQEAADAAGMKARAVESWQEASPERYLVTFSEVNHSTFAP